MKERLDPPEPIEATYNVEITVLVKGVRAVDGQQAGRLALLNIRDGEVVNVDPYIEEPETDHDDLDD